jgi:uncharacterized membrane protein
VRLHFQEKPWDLYAAVGYATAVSVVLLLLNVGDFLAIPFVVFVPGYVLVAALFPGSSNPERWEIDWTERIALSFGLSIAVVPLLALLLNFTPWGIRFAPIILTIALFSVGVGAVAFWYRMRLPPERRLSATLTLSLSAWHEYSRLEKKLAITLAASIVLGGGTLAYVVLTPRHSETFTEFFILGPGGNVSGYPTALNVSQPGTVIPGIANHESATVNYTVRIDLVGVRIVYNTTAKANETVELNRTTWSSFNVTLVAGANWTQPYTFSIRFVGLWKVQFLLFKDGNFSAAYRELHLYVRVS